MAIDIDASYYKTGTATVAANGTTVTGQGTQWTSSVRAGDLFGTHVGMPTRILTVNSNTQLTLAYPWKGPAQTATSYEVQFTPYDTGYYPAVRQLLQTMTSGNVEAFAGLTSAADTMAYFTGAGTMGLTALTALARTFLSRTTGAGMYGDLGEIPNANLPARLQTGSPNIGNANNATENGFYSADNTSTNVPSGSPAVVLSVRYSATGGYQRWVSLTGTSVYERRQSGGTWSAWKRVDIAASFGASSGYFILPSSSGDLIVQFGTTTASTDSSGYGDFALATTYPTAQITCLMNTGNYSASSSVIGPRTGATDLTTSRVYFRSGTTSSLIRINYISIGY